LDERFLRSATAFCGGIGGTREELCGAFSAGVMLVSARYGRLTPHEDELPAYARARAFRLRFLLRWKTLRCAPLREQIYSPGGPGSCVAVGEETVRILLNLLEGA
jgi:hypothetical protein